MKERFFFDRVKVRRYELAVDKRVEHAAYVLPDAAHPELAVRYVASERAKKAVNIAAFGGLIELSLSHDSLNDVKLQAARI